MSASPFKVSFVRFQLQKYFSSLDLIESDGLTDAAFNWFFDGELDGGLSFEWRIAL